jgi:uroporphyrinogen-III synthase
VTPLPGLGVLVTRPEAQAAPLVGLLERAGARVHRLPAIEIVPAPDREALRASVGPIDRYRWLMFVSTNAVRYGAFLLEDAASLPQFAAVGPATAAAIERAGLRVGVVPASGFDSEALLASPELTNVAGARVLIVRGDGGRELMGEELRRRGAEVQYVEVYARRRAAPAPEVVRAIEEAWTRGEIDVVTATSAELHGCLLEILSPAGRALLNRTALLAGGTRIADAARRMGHAGEIVVARAADDASLLDALIERQRHTSDS